MKNADMQITRDNQKKNNKKTTNNDNDDLIMRECVLQSEKLRVRQDHQKGNRNIFYKLKYILKETMNFAYYVNY